LGNLQTTNLAKTPTVLCRAYGVIEKLHLLATNTKDR